jgi:hypothetical protein
MTDAIGIIAIIICFALLAAALFLSLVFLKRLAESNHPLDSSNRKGEVMRKLVVISAIVAAFLFQTGTASACSSSNRSGEVESNVGCTLTGKVVSRAGHHVAEGQTRFEVHASGTWKCKVYFYSNGSFEGVACFRGNSYVLYQAR